MAREGDLMLAALIGDLLELPGVQVSFARDARLALPPGARRRAQVYWRAPRRPPMEALAQEIDSSDAVWPIAPETGGELERVARAITASNRVLLGPDPDAIALAGSKLATAQCLAEAHIDVVPCFRSGSNWPPIARGWVVKPNDGAGGFETRLFESREEAAAALDRRPGLIAQPWIDGEAMSLSVLATPERVAVLSVNRQLVRVSQGIVELTAIDVNCEPVTASLATLAEGVAAAIPGLRGYFGIDFVRTIGRPVVIEINPRLTTSYAGLKLALGVNVAQCVLAAATGGSCAPVRGHAGRAVRLTLNSDAID